VTSSRVIGSVSEGDVRTRVKNREISSETNEREKEGKISIKQKNEESKIDGSRPKLERANNERKQI